TWTPGDSVFLVSTTCDAAATGVLVQNLTNQYGCDSTVTTTVTLLPSDEVFLTETTCDPTVAGVFVENLTNQNSCDSIVTTTISLLPSDQIFLAETTCDPTTAGIFVQNLTNQNGCDSIVTLTISLLPSDTTFVTLEVCDPAQAGETVSIFTNQFGCDSMVVQEVVFVPNPPVALHFFTCDPAQVGETTVVFTDQNGCDSMVVTTTEMFPLPSLEVTAVTYFGVAIRCAGGSDGVAEAEADGAAPFQFLWSNGAVSEQVENLTAGNYSVTLTDANGCTAVGSVLLDEAELLGISLAINELECFDVNEGMIEARVSGGMSPVLFSLNGGEFQASNTFTGLTAGTYLLTALDANDCEASEIIFINAPVPVDVDLGDNLFIDLGEGVTLQALVNVPFDSLASVSWFPPDSSECPECLEHPVAPLVTTTYSISILANNGSADVPV
ncbi:MAG: hypothetical protein AAB316_07790, partial [Bacteroidota bacterium]